MEMIFGSHLAGSELNLVRAVPELAIRALSYPIDSTLCPNRRPLS